MPRAKAAQSPNAILIVVTTAIIWVAKVSEDPAKPVRI